MSVDCEIENCGVIAVGRCFVCQRAFCTSHRAFRMGAILTDMCSPCEAARVEAEREPHRRDWDALQFVKGAPALLRESGIAATTIYEARSKWEKSGLLRRYRQITELTPWGSGWILGMAKWRLPVAGSETAQRVSDHLTALVDEATDMPNNGLVMAGELEGDIVYQGQMGFCGSHFFLGDLAVLSHRSGAKSAWESVADLIRAKLAAASDS